MISRKKYTHIFLDLDNTLWDFEKNSRYAMEATFKQLKVGEKGVDFSLFFEVYSENNHKLWAAYRKKEIKKKDLTRERFQLTFDALQIKGMDAPEMNDLYLAEMPKQKFLMDGAMEILEYLKSKRYKLFIITNGFKEVQHKKLESSGLGKYFDKVFISEEIKCPKPGREIFEHAIKSANAKKVSSIMIGDDWDVDVLGAVNFGIDAVYFSNGKFKKAIQTNKVDSVNHKIHEIVTLSELRELL